MLEGLAPDAPAAAAVTPTVPEFRTTVHANGASPLAEQAVSHALAMVTAGLPPDTVNHLSNVELVVDIVPRGKEIADLPGWEMSATRKWKTGNVAVNYKDIGGVTRSRFDVLASGRQIDTIDAVSGRPPQFGLSVVSADGAPISFRGHIVVTEWAILVGLAQFLDRNPGASPDRGARLLFGAPVHEIGHFVYFATLTDEQRGSIGRLFCARTASGGPWTSDHASHTAREYFADGVAALFAAPEPDAVKSHYTAQWLSAHDPGLYLALRGVFPNAKQAIQTNGVRLDEPRVGPT